MPIDRRLQTPHQPDSDTPALEHPRAVAARLEYDRLMAEAKRDFDRLTTQNVMARSRVTPRAKLTP